MIARINVNTDSFKTLSLAGLMFLAAFKARMYRTVDIRKVRTAPA